MRVILYQLRAHGRPLPQRCLPGEPVGTGSLCLAHGRTYSVLTWQPDCSVRAEEGIHLYDPKLINLNSGGMRFRGFQTLGPDGPSVLQEWLCRLLG